MPVTGFCIRQNPLAETRLQQTGWINAAKMKIITCPAMALKESPIIPEAGKERC